MTYPYDEQQCIAHQTDVRLTYAEKGEPYHIADDAHIVWATRMQFRAVTEGYPAARRAVILELRTQLGLPNPFPSAPTRDELLNGQITMQGLMVQTSRFGTIPWFPGALPWFSEQECVDEIFPQLRAAGDTICLIGLPSGYPLYDEPPPNFYTADKFPALDWTSGGTAIDPVFVRRCELAIQAGFKGIWVFLDGDDGHTIDPNGHTHGFNIVTAQAPLLAAALQSSPYADLRPYCVTMCGWDGVWYGYTPDEVRLWGQQMFDLGLMCGIEHQTGRPLAGNGAADYQPGGPMEHYSLILGEFDDDRWDDSVWEILARELPPGAYKYPGYLQPIGNDPPPHPHYLINGAVFRVFEYYIYGFVRGTPSAHVQQCKQHFIDMGASNVC